MRAIAKLTILACISQCIAFPAASEITDDANQAQLTLDQFAASLKVRYTVIDNHPGNCPDGLISCFHGKIELDSPMAPPPGWALYFNTEAHFLSQSSDGLHEKAINGDLHEIRADVLSRRAPFKNDIDFIASGAQPTPYYAMPNWYITAPRTVPKIIESTRTHLDADTELESNDFVAPFVDENALAKRWPQDLTSWPTASDLYTRYQAASQAGGVPDPYRVIPQPFAMRVDEHAQSLDLRKGIVMHLSGFDRARLGTGIARLLRHVSESSNGTPVYLAKSGNHRFGPERYTLRTDAIGVHIEARDESGADYALVTLTQLVDHAESLPRLQIDDQPRYPFRGLHIDVARNFPGKLELLRLLDQMEAYKLNKLHLHLSDDQGWRLQIPGLPELTDIGAHRCHDLDERSCILPQLGSGPTAGGPGDGYLSKQDYVGLVRAAAARHIEVIPSFDMPGHSHAAIAAMEARFETLQAAGDPIGAARYRLRDPDDHSSYISVQGFGGNTINVCMDSSYAFFEKILDEVTKMHAEAGAPLRRYHIGGDETPGAWKESPACAALAASMHLPIAKLGGVFLSRTAKAVALRGIVPGAWSDGLAGADVAAMPKPMQSNTWEMLFYGGPDLAHRQMNQKGMQVILSIPDVSYFDQPYSSDPHELGNGWATRDLDETKAFGFIPDNLGANGYFWKNLLGESARVDDTVELLPGRHAYGMQAQLWTEFVHSPRQVEYMLFPRLVAYAERAWHRASWEIPYAGPTSGIAVPGNVTDIIRQRDRDWSSFAFAMSKKILPELDDDDIAYRIPPPGGMVSNGTLHANALYTGLPIQYRIDAGQWKDYTYPVHVPDNSVISIRSLSANGKRVGREISVNRSHN